MIARGDRLAHPRTADLRVLRAVLETRTVAEAAAITGLTVPALRRRLYRLYSERGIPIDGMTAGRAAWLLHDELAALDA